MKLSKVLRKKMMSEVLEITLKISEIGANFVRKKYFAEK